LKFSVVSPQFSENQEQTRNFEIVSKDFAASAEKAALPTTESGSLAQSQKFGWPYKFDFRSNNTVQKWRTLFVVTLASHLCSSSKTV